MAFERIFLLQELAAGRGRTVKDGGKQIALFQSEGGEVHAVDNLCPHEGYPLASGAVQDGVLTCEWHNWKFDLLSGDCLFGGEPVRRYLTRVPVRGVHVVVGWIELFLGLGHGRRGCRGSGRYGISRRRWCGRRRGLRRQRGVDAGIDVHLGLEVVRLLLELLAELARHRARAADPAAHLLRELRQFLRTEHDQGDREDQQQL